MIAHPGLPQIRTCRITASGSSGDTFASLYRELVAGETLTDDRFISPALLSAVVALTRFRSSVSPACFPPTVLSPDALLPSTGSFRASSPASTVLSGRYDFLPPVSPYFVAFAWRYHGSIRLVSCLPSSPNAKRRAWGFVARCPRPGFLPWRRQDLPRSWGTLCAFALLYDPGGIVTPDHYDVKTRPPL